MSSDSLEVALPSLDVCVSRVTLVPVCEWSDRMSEILQPGNCTRQKNDVYYDGTSDVGANKLKGCLDVPYRHSSRALFDGRILQM